MCDNAQMGQRHVFIIDMKFKQDRAAWWQAKHYICFAIASSSQSSAVTALDKAVMR
jgi:hypothetical protein